MICPTPGWPTPADTARVQQDTAARRAEWLRLRLDGLSYREIGRRVGVSGQRVQQVLAPPSRIVKQVRQRANGRCENCGIQVRSNGAVHHRAATVVTYDDSVNLQYLCRTCHRLAHQDQDKAAITQLLKTAHVRKSDDVVSISEAARRLGVSRPTIYARLAIGLLRGKRVGDRTLVKLPRATDSRL